MLRSSQSSSPSSGNHLIGMNISGERVLVVFGSLSGRVYESLSFTPSTDEPFASTLEDISKVTDKLLNLTQAQRLPLPEKLSVCVSGNFDELTGKLETSPDFPLWRSEPLRSQLSVRFNLPTIVANQADSGAMSEVLFGDGKEMRNLIFVSPASSVRLGILMDGSLYRNTGGTAGELGLMPMDTSDPTEPILNTYASPKGIVALGKQLSPQHWPEDVSLTDMIKAANQEDPYARELFDFIANKLGKALSGAIHILRPDQVVIGQPLCQLGSWMLQSLRASLSEAAQLSESRLPKVVFSGLCNRLPELQALAPAVFASRPQAK